MIEISEELRNHFLTDSTTNNLVVDARIKGDGSVDYTNFYTGDVETYSEIIDSREFHLLANRFPESYSFKDYVNTKYLTTRSLFCLSFNLHITSYTSLPEYLSVGITFSGKDGQGYWYPLANAIKTSDYLEAPRKVAYTHSSGIGQTWEVDWFDRFFIYVAEGDPDFIAAITVSDIQLEFTNDSTTVPRNYNKSFDNDDVVFESFTYKESLCSKDNLKFGLCEASNAEFSIMNDNYVLNDARLRLYIRDNDDPINQNVLNGLNWYLNTTTPSQNPSDIKNYPSWHINSGRSRFDMESANLIETNIEPYLDYYRNKYIGVACKLKINSITYNGNPQNIKYLNPKVWGYYGTWGNAWGWGINSSKVELTDLLSDYVYCYATLPWVTDAQGNLVGISDFYFYLWDENESPVTLVDRLDIDYSIKEFGVYIVDTPYTRVIPYNAQNNIIFNDTYDEYKNIIENRVPMGTFYVSEVKKKINHLLEEKTLTAYDNIIKLEQNAADWYTQYMFGLSFIGYNGVGFEYARQIYSSLFDYMRKIGLDYRDNYEEELVASYTKSEILASHLSSKRLKYADGQHFDFRFAEFNVNTVTSRRYCVLLSYDDGIGTLKAWFRDHYDLLFRGVLSANILIEETRANHPNNKYVVDSGDYFMVSEDCTSFKVYVVCYFEDTDDNSISKQIINSVTITEVTDFIELENGNIRLLYYDWNTQEIFPCETSITGRDVVRSLLEPCGCLFRLNRETNMPEFVYCTKGGLYPAENLYPADDLYPRSGTDTMLSTGKYMSFERGESEVQNFGRIQIKKGGSTNEAEPICQWEYIGDANEINTYIIDDNIFYCAENMVYSPGMIEVSEMLENMWYRISNMGYVANITTAIGMPWVECGDRIGILTMVGGAETFVFRRTLKGIQMLTDTYESNGDEYVKAISNYNYGG